MKQDAKIERQREIETAAYALVEEKGYLGTSMLAVARRARASNETLYNWYGDKLGLFKALVASNTQTAREVLEASMNNNAGFDANLLQFGTTILMTVLGDRAIALNKAAASDPTGELGDILAKAGRETVLPLLQRMFRQEIPRGSILTDKDIAQTYLALLISDRQIRRVIGSLPEPTEKECHKISQNALLKLKYLLRVTEKIEG